MQRKIKNKFFLVGCGKKMFEGTVLIYVATGKSVDIDQESEQVK